MRLCETLRNMKSKQLPGRVMFLTKTSMFADMSCTAASVVRMTEICRHSVYVCTS